MKNGFCAVDGKIQTQFDAPVKKGQTVTVSGENAMRHSLPFRILYEDEKIVVIDKPARSSFRCQRKREGAHSIQNSFGLCKIGGPKRKNLCCPPS